MLQELFKDNTSCHSGFQIDNFILHSNGGTLYGQYKQSLRELFNRCTAVADLIKDIEIHEIETEEMREELSKTSSGYTQRRLTAEINHKDFYLSFKNKRLEETLGELSRFYCHAVFMKEKLGDISVEKRDRLERELWLYRVKEMIALDVLATSRPSKPVLEIIKSLPYDIRKDVTKFLKSENADEIIRWYENEQGYRLPEVEIKLIDREDINALLTQV